MYFPLTIILVWTRISCATRPPAYSPNRPLRAATRNPIKNQNLVAARGRGGTTAGGGVPAAGWGGANAAGGEPTSGQASGSRMGEVGPLASVVL